jgi:hypothetical protein
VFLSKLRAIKTVVILSVLASGLATSLLPTDREVYRQLCKIAIGVLRIFA